MPSDCVFTPLQEGDAVGSEVVGDSDGEAVGSEVVGPKVRAEVPGAVVGEVVGDVVGEFVGAHVIAQHTAPQNSMKFVTPQQNE